MIVGFEVMSAFTAAYVVGGFILCWKGRISPMSVFDCLIQTTVTASIIMAISSVNACNGICCYDTYTCYLKHDYSCANEFQRNYCSTTRPPLSSWLFPICLLYGLQLFIYAWSSFFYIELFDPPQLAGSWHGRYLIKRRAHSAHSPHFSYVALAVVLNLKHTYNVLCAFFPEVSPSPALLQAASPSHTHLLGVAAKEEAQAPDLGDGLRPVPSAPVRPLSVDGVTALCQPALLPADVLLSVGVDGPAALVPMAHATVIFPTDSVPQMIVPALSAPLSSRHRQYLCLKCLWHITYVEGSAVLVCPQCLTSWSAP